jgi:hypothetical protein
MGMFTKAFMDRFPLIPVEEEGRLQDPVLREWKKRTEPDGPVLFHDVIL